MPTDGSFGRKSFGMSEVVYRIDPASGRWCSYDCKTTNDITSISDREIVLAQYKDEVFSMKMALNRESGDFAMHYRNGGDRAIVKTGSCKKATFTGFPAPKF